MNCKYHNTNVLYVHDKINVIKIELQISINRFVVDTTQFNLSITGVGCHGNTSIIHFHIGIEQSGRVLLILSKCPFTWSCSKQGTYRVNLTIL